MTNIHFMKNWNNKLDCDIFTTIRVYNPNRHYIGAEYTITWLHDNLILTLEPRVCIHMNTFKLAILTNGLALLDTGYNAKETTSMIRAMYKNKNIDVDQVTFCALYLKRIKQGTPPKVTG